MHLYRMISVALERMTKGSALIDRLADAIANVGQSSLFYLLMSNLLIFALEGSKFVYPNPVMAFVYYIIIMYLIYYFRKTVKQ